MPNKSFENTPRPESREYESLLPMLEQGLVEVFGEIDAGEHIQAIREFDSADVGINYIYGALLANGYKPEDILIAMGVLEPDTKTE